MFDCHIHSQFSSDSTMDAVDACETALHRKLEGLIFTDHLDFDYPGFENDFIIDFDMYSRFMDELKGTYSGRLKVLKGIETGIQPHVMKETQEVVNRYNFDYVIGSVHIINRQDPYVGGYYGDQTRQQAYDRYLEEILYMLQHYSHFDVLGHIDYIIRYGPYAERGLRYEEHQERIDCILRTLVAKGKGMEVNTASYRVKAGKKTVEYDIAILQRYRELGGEIICLGSDAHSAEYIGYKFSDFCKLLMDCGFQYICHFENRRPVFNKII